MDELDLYDDLDEFQEQQEKKSKEIKEVEEKYQQSLKTIEGLREENKNLKKNIQSLELGFQSLLDTARAEINRKNKEIERLRKEKDDICFRRKIPQNVASESEKQRLVNNPFRFNTTQDSENLLTKINSKPTASHTDKEEKPESNKRSRHHDEKELINSTDYKRNRIARDEQNDKYQYSSHKIDKPCSKTEDNHRGYRENDKDSMYRKDHNRNHSRGRKEYDKSNSRNPHRDFRKSSESPERYKKNSDRSSSTECKRYNSKQKVYDRSRSREGKHSAIFSKTSSKSPTPNIKPNRRDTNRDSYYHEKSSKKTENEKSHKTVDDLGELKSKVFEGAKNPITTENSQREICNMPTSKHNLEPRSRCDQKISQNSAIVHIKDQEKIQSVKKLAKENETKQKLSLSSIPKTSEIGTARKVALYNEIFGKSPSESSTTASSNILLNSIKSILDKTSQIEVISSATTSPGDYTDISSCTSTPLKNSTKIKSTIKTSSDSIMEVNKDKTMTKKSLGDTSEIDSCFIPTQQNLEQNIKSVAYIDLTEVVNDDIASELEYVQIPGLDLCFRDGDSTIKNKTITMADIENTDNSLKTNKRATCGKEWTQQINNKFKTKSNQFLETFHPISEKEIEKELSISTEKEFLNKVPNAIRKEVPTTDVLLISPLKQKTNVSEISSIKKILSHENSEKLKNITKNLANEVVVIETLKSTIIDVDLIRNENHCLDKDVYKTTKPVETFLKHNEESEKENNNRKITEDNENVGLDESMHTKSLTDETRSLDRSKCETAAIKIPLVVSSIASSLPEKSICHSVAFDNFDVSVRSLELESNTEEQTEPLSSTQDISKVVQSKKQNLAENLLNSACIFNTVDHETQIIGKSQITDKNRLVKSHIDGKFVEKEVLESEKLTDPDELAKVVDVEVLESKTENESSTQTHLSETLPNTVSTFKFLDCATHIAERCCAEESDNQNVREIEVEKEIQSDTIVACNLSNTESVEVVQSKELHMSEHCKKNYDFQAIEKEKPDPKIPVNLLPEELIINMENACENETYDKVVSTKTQLYFEDNLNDNEAVERVQQFDSGATNELSRQEVVQRINENIFFSSIEQENSTAFTEISTKTDKANKKDKNVAEITNPDISEKLFNNTENNADTKLSTETPSVERESNIDCTLDEAKEKACQKPVEDKIFTQYIHENCQKNTQHLSSFKDKCTTSFTPEKLLPSIIGFENETSTKDLIHEKCNEWEATTNYLSSNDIEYANNSNNDSKLISSVSSKNIDLILDSCDSTANKVESLQKSISSTLEEKTNSLEKDETKTKPAILDLHIPSAEEKRTDDNAGFNFLGSGKNCEETMTQINVTENILDKKVENFKNETSLHTNMERSTVNIEELHAKQQESNNKTATPIADTSVETTAIPDAINSNEKQKSLTPKIANEQAALELHKISENSLTSSRNDETIVRSADNSNHKQESLSTDTSLEVKTIQHSLNNAKSPVKLCNSITVFGTNQEDKAELELIDLKESEIKERESYNRTLEKNENQENVKHADSDHFNKTKDSQKTLIVNEGDESSNVSESKDMEHSRNTQETLKLSTNKSGNPIETKTKTNLKNNVETLEAASDKIDVSDLIPTEFNIENKLNNSEVESGNNSTKPSKNDIPSFVLKSAVEKVHVAVIKDKTPNDTALYQSVEINGDLEHLEKDESDNDTKENKSKQRSENHPISNKPEDAICSNHSIMSIQQTSVESTKEKDEKTLKLNKNLQTQKLLLSHKIESEIKDNELKCDSTNSIKNNDILDKLTAQLSDNKNERVQEESGTSMKLTEQLPNNDKEGPDSHVLASLNEETSKVLQQDIDNDPIRSSEITYNDDDLKMGNSNNKLGKFLSNPSLPIGYKVASKQDSSNHKEESITTDASLEIKTIQLSINNAESPVKLSSSITVFGTNQEDEAELEFIDLEESEIKERKSYNRTHGSSEKQENVQHTDCDHFNKTKDSQTVFIVTEDDARNNVIESKDLEHSPNKLQNLEKPVCQEILKLYTHKTGNSVETKTKTSLRNDVETLEVVTARSDVNDLIPTEFNIENKLNNSEVETGNNLTKPSKNDILSIVLESTVEKVQVAVIKDQTPNDTALYQSVEINGDLEHLENDESDNDKKEKKSKQVSENHATPIPETAKDIQFFSTPEVAINSQHSIISIQQTSVGSIAKKDEKSNTNTKMKDHIPNDTALYKSVEINEDIEHLEKDKSDNDNDKKEIKSKQESENHPISNKPEDAIGSNHSIISIQQTSEKDEQTFKLKESLQTQKLMLSHNIESEIKDNEFKCDSTTSIKKNDKLVKLTAQLSSNKNEIVQEIADTSMKLIEKLPNNVKEGPDSHVSANLNEETTKVLQQDIDNDTIRSSEITNNNDDLKIDNSYSKILAYKTSNRPQETESDIKNIIVNNESAKNKTICDLFKDKEERSIHSSLQVEANAIERPVQIETLTLNCGPGTKKDNINKSPCLEKSKNISDKVKSTDYAFKENYSDTSLLKSNCIFNEKQTKSQTVNIKNAETNSHEISKVCKIVPPLVYWNINKVGMETQETNFEQDRINRLIYKTQTCKQIRTKEINIEGKIIEVVKILADESHIINKTIDMSKQTTDNLTKTQCFINEIEQQTQAKSNNLNIVTCDYNRPQLSPVIIAKPTIPNENSEVEEIESKIPRKEIEENQYQTPKKVQSSSVDHQITDITFPSKEELSTVSTMLPETFGTHPILPSISTTSPTPSNFSGIFSKKSSSSVITEDDFNKPKKKSPHLSSKPKEYILPAASVLCNVDNLEYATKINKKLHWELLENKNELTEIEDDVDIDTTDEEQLKIKEEPLENASSSPKQISLQTKLVNRMSQKSSPSETDTQTEDESLLNDLRQQKEKHKRIKLSKVHKTKQRKNTKLPKTVRARLQSIGMRNVDTFVDSGSLIKQNSVSINLPKRKVGRPRKAEKRGAFAEHQKKRGRKPKPKENKSQQEIARNTTFRCKLVNCKESKIVENKSLDGIDVINNLENSVKILSTSVERLEICDEPCTSRESVKQSKSFEKSFKDNTNKDIYNALLIFNKEDSLTNNANKSIIGKSSTLCNNNLQENNFCDFTDKGNISTETVSLIKLPKVSETSKETEESKMIEINNCEKANVHSDRPKEDPSSSRETQKIRLVHKSDRETDKVFSEKTKSSSSEETQDNRFLNKSDSETDDGLTEDHDEDLKTKKSLKTKSILKPIIKKKLKSKSHKNRVTNFISLEDIGIKVRPLKGHLSSFRIPKIKKDSEDKIDKSWKLETYIELENEGIDKEINEQSEHKRESPKILHDNISTDSSIKDRRLNIKEHAEEIVDNSLKLKASTEFEAGSVQNHFDNGKEGSKEQNRTECCQGKQLRDNSSKEQVTGRHMKLTDKELKKEEEQHNTNPKQRTNEEKTLPSNYMIKFDNKTKTGKRKLFSTEMYDERDAEDQVEVAAENKQTEIINKQNLSKTDEPNSGEYQKSLHLPSHIANKESSENKSIKSRRKSIVHRTIFDSSSDEDTNSNDKKTISDKPMSNELTKNTQTFKSSPDLDTSLKEHPASSALNRKESKKSLGVRRKSVYFESDCEKSTLKEVGKNKIDESSAANLIQPLEQQSNIENSELNENKVKQSNTKNSTVEGVETEQNKTDIVNKDISDFKLAENQNSCINNKNLSENSMKDNNMQQLPTKAIKSDKLRRKSMYVESKALKLSPPELVKVTKKPITHANNEHWNCKDMKSLDLDQDVYKNRNTNLEIPAPVKNISDQAKPKASLKLRRKSMYVENSSLYIEKDNKDTKDLLERETRSPNKDSIPLINSELSGTNIPVQQHTTKMQRKSTTQQDKSISKDVEENAEDSKEAPAKEKKHLISEKKVENNIGNSKNTDKGSDSVGMRRKSTNQQKKFDTCNSLNNHKQQNTKELGLDVDNNQKIEPDFDSSVAVNQNEAIKTNTKCANQRKIYDSDIPDQILSNTGEVKDSDTKELKNKSGKISTHTDKSPVSAASAVASKEKSIKMRRKSTTQRQITNCIIMKQDHKVHSDIVNKSEQQPLEILRNIDHNPQIISTSDSSPALTQAKKNRRKSTNYHEDSSNVLKENPENHKAADSEVSISLTQRNQEMKKNADQLKISKEKSKVLLNQDTGNTTESLYAFREKIQEIHEEATLKSNGGHDKDCDSNTSVVLKQQKPFEIRRKSTNQRRILDSSSDDEPLIKKPTVTPIKVKTAPTTVAKQKQRKRRVVKVLSTSMESPADVTNTSQQFDCHPFSFTSPTLNHPIFNTEVSTQSSEFVASLPVTPNQQDDNKFKEIDSKLHEIFQSPQYAVDYKTSPTVAAANLINLPPPLNDANITIDETHDFNEENDQSGLNISQINESTVTLNETTAIHNKSEVKHLSLGSAEYRFEKVSDNVINLFISRKRKRKRNN